MSELNVYWGDFHKHLVDVEMIDEILEDTKYNLDFYPILFYPFNRETEPYNGLLVETVRQRPGFPESWELINQAAKKHNQPGEFVTFTGYEWHGNRSRWGDHNVIYFDEGNPLDDTWELRDLYENLKKRKAMAIPHHTGYMPGFRGKDWDVFDPQLSPVMEIFSVHGCSEAIDSPLPLPQNLSMGPRVSGGNYVDALNRGLRIGAIGSNDARGLPGSWGRGVAAVCAEELTREAIWESVLKRRTYASTGDRINLMFKINDNLMGSEIIPKPGEKFNAEISLDCVQPLDRVDLIHNGAIFDSYIHKRKVDNSSGIFRILIEFGWGPSSVYGFDEKDTLMNWKGTINIENGKINKIYPRLSGYGQSYACDDKAKCSFKFNTSRDDPEKLIMGLVLEVKGDEETQLTLNITDQQIPIKISEIINQSRLIPLLDESEQRIFDHFKVKKQDVENPDVFFHNARKIRVSPAYHQEQCSADLTFENLPVAQGDNYYYVRASQIDGQTVWSSPIWITKQ